MKKQLLTIAIFLMTNFSIYSNTKNIPSPEMRVKIEQSSAEELINLIKLKKKEKEQKEWEQLKRDCQNSQKKSNNFGFFLLATGVAACFYLR